MRNVLKNFAELLGERFSRGVLTTEDSIRYTFFAALMKRTLLEPHDVILEYPHPRIAKARIDTWLPSFGGQPVAIEFKYDRQIPSGAALPRPQNVGELFKDIARLNKLNTTPKPLRLLVYCTDSIMAAYLSNPANGHTSFFNLPEGQRKRIDSSYFADKPVTFRESVGGDATVDLLCRWSQSLPGKHQLRTYEILPVGDEM